MSATTTVGRVGETLLVPIHGVAELATCYAESPDGEVVSWRTEDGKISGHWLGRLWDLSRLRQGCGRRVD